MPNLQVTITLDPTTGAVQLGGPLEQPIVVLGLLEMGKATYLDHLKKQAEGNRIVPVQGTLPRLS